MLRLSTPSQIPNLAMAVTDVDRRRYIAENVTADLQYVLQDAEISLVNQYAVTQHYKNLRVFSQIGDTKAEVRTALKDDFRLDPTTGPEVRAEVARFISAWEVSKELLIQQKNRNFVQKQRFWACRDTCKTMRGKRCSGP